MGLSSARVPIVSTSREVGRRPANMLKRAESTSLKGVTADQPSRVAATSDQGPVGST